MELQAQVDELQRLGFTLLDRQQDRVDAIRCRWHFDLMFTQVTAVVRVRQVERLDEDLLASDRQELSTLLDTHDPSMLPRGFQKGRITVATYLCDQATTSAMQQAEAAPVLQFAAFHIAGIRDAAGVHAYTGTRVWGAIYYPLLKFLVRSMLEPKGEPEPFSVSALLLMVLLIVLCTLPFLMMFN